MPDISAIRAKLDPIFREAVIRALSKDTEAVDVALCRFNTVDHFVAYIAHRVQGAIVGQWNIDDPEHVAWANDFCTRGKVTHYKNGGTELPASNNEFVQAVCAEAYRQLRREHA